MRILSVVSQIDDLVRFRGKDGAVRNHWAPARTEGRSAINCGLGFGLMGHEVDLCSITFDPAQISDNVRLINSVPLDAYYDIVYSVRTHIHRGKCGRQLNSITQENHCPAYATLTKSQFPNIEFYGNVKLITQMFQQPGMQVEPEVLPFLFPIPCLPGLTEQKFIPFHWDKNKKKQKIWIYNGRLPYNGFNTTLQVLRRLRDYHKYDLEVYQFTNPRGPEAWPPGWDGFVPFEAEIRKEFNVTIVEGWKQSYYDVLTLLQQMDMCATHGDPCSPGSCAWDIISLGKPLFYSTIEFWNSRGINEMFRLPWTFYFYDETKAINEKVDKMVADPQKCVEDFQNAVSYYSFPVWKQHMEKVLNKKL